MHSFSSWKDDIEHTRIRLTKINYIIDPGMDGMDRMMSMIVIILPCFTIVT